MLGMLRAMAGNLPNQLRTQLCQKIFQLFDTSPRIDIARYPLEFEISSSGEFCLLKNEESQPESLGSVEEPQAINTVGIQRDLKILEAWLSQLQPLLIVGPEGCGKSLLVRTAIVHLRKSQNKVSISTIHCNA